MDTSDLSTEITGNYIELLDEEKYVTGLKIKSLKWKILNNLLGSKDIVHSYEKQTN